MIVIKIGGASGINLDYVCDDAAALTQGGESIVVVHGGSAETNELSAQLGRPPRFLTSPSGFTSRYTDRATLEIFAMVTAGKISALLVEQLQRRGVNALSLCGADGRLMVAERKAAVRAVENGRQRVIRDDFTGKVTQVNAPLLHTLVREGYTPVIAPLAISPQGELVNVDADRAAAMVAAALGAEALILLTNVPGLLRHFPDESTLIPHIDKSKVEQSLEFAEGRMKKKVLGASEALAGGVQRVIFADGRVASPIQNALAGRGTVIA